MIRSILIVGGGSAGWMAAAFLSHFLDASKCRITLVESSETGTIGVGEATVPPLAAFLRMLDIDEHEFMSACNATYKLGIRFIDWRSGADAYWHPFGNNGGVLAGLPVFQHWLRRRLDGIDNAPHTAYSLQIALCEAGRAPRSLHDPSPVMQQGGYAYHLDARAFADFLGARARSAGVHHIVDDVRDATVDANGMIGAVHTARHGTLQADLYIDCSGFAALLSERALADPFIDWSGQLLCDSAVVMPLPADPSLPPYTTATALRHGWAWRIALQHRTGNGYVYSSRHVERAAAEAEFRQHLGAPSNAVEATHLRMRVGRRTRFWAGNCVAIGLAAGFLEPLESTGLFLIQKGIDLLLEHLPDGAMDPLLAQRYNDDMGSLYDEIRDFIVMHYVLSERDDTPFWRAARTVEVPPELARCLEFYDRTGRVGWPHPQLFPHLSFCAIAAGMGRIPRAAHPLADFADPAAISKALEALTSRHRDIIRAMPDQRTLFASQAASRGRGTRTGA